MSKITTSSVSDITKTTLIMYGRLEEKSAQMFGVGFCYKEGSTGDPNVQTDPVVGLITGDIPLCKFASTVINLKENTRYRYRAVGADFSKPTYLISPQFPGVSIVEDDRGLAEGDTNISVIYTATTKHALINNVWDIDFSAGGVITTTVPPEMGGEGTATITWNVDLNLLPTTDFSGNVTINKIPYNIFYGVTKSFRTR